MELGKVVVAGVRPPGAETDQLTVFVLHRGDLAEFPALAATISRLINEQAGLEVVQVVPVKRIPKTTSGKIQRHLLEQQLVDGEFAADLAEITRHSGGLQPASAPPQIPSRRGCSPSAMACSPHARWDRMTISSRSARAR